MTFNPADRIKKVQKSATRRLYDAAPQGSINLGLGEPDFLTPTVIRNEATRVIREERLGYTPNAGLLALREKIADYTSVGLKQATGADFVCVTNGAEEALFAVMMAILNPGDEAVLPNPGFSAYATIAEIAGAKVVPFAMPAANGFQFDRDNFAKAITDKTKLALIVSPSNPTSRVMARDDLQFIADCLHGSKVYVIADEIYRDLYFTEERPASLAEFYDQTIVVSGMSKMMSMTGWRLGWAVAAPEVIQSVTVMHQYISACASSVSQKAALAAFTDAGREATRRMREILRERRDVMTQAIERELGLPYVSGEGGFYIMLDVSRYGESEEVAMRLLEERVITVPGDAFGAQGRGYLRLSFCIEAALIEAGIRRIAKGL
ncbi:MAG: aminotransferase class I/II-fold pyridoxal phosphate-dependent enzyme [Acidobacteria bacterium]|nr:aminotransferase class I/II-fold pyridoxal phosphate-dependent enzyme [Acidobacteriota bacterium]